MALAMASLAQKAKRTHF